jgi:hypothetical protein
VTAVRSSDIASLMTLDISSLLSCIHLIGAIGAVGVVVLTFPQIHPCLNPRRRCLRRPSRLEGCFATGTEEVRCLAIQDRQGMEIILVSPTPTALMSPTLVLAASMR